MQGVATGKQVGGTKKCAPTIWEHNFHLTKCLFVVFL
jgi:hypothetical protein